jgi:hypothetical protein
MQDAKPVLPREEETSCGAPEPSDSLVPNSRSYAHNSTMKALHQLRQLRVVDNEDKDKDEREGEEEEREEEEREEEEREEEESSRERWRKVSSLRSEDELSSPDYTTCSGSDY